MALQKVHDLLAVGPVQIDRIDVTEVAVPMREPFRISSGEVSEKQATLVRLSNSHAFGWGESSAMPGAFYSQDTPESCAAQVVQTAPLLVGRSFSTMGELEAFLISQKLSPFVRVAFETAAWELVARERNLSLRSLFGLPDAVVETGLAVGLYPSLSELRAALERYDACSYSRLKIKIKQGQDIALVRAVREWYGDIPLFVDANADYTREHLDLFVEMDRYGLMMIEQPFHRSDVETSAALQKRINTPICFDEGVESVADVLQAAELDACRIVNIKLQRVGGFLEALRIAEACAECKLPLWMGTMPELGVGSAQALVLATHPANAYPTDVEPSSRWYEGDIISPELTKQRSTLIDSGGEGLGFVVDEGLLRKYARGSRSFC